MCFNNSAQVVCGTPLSYYRENPKRAIRYCVRTLATVVFELVKQNKGPHSVSSAEFTNRFLPDLRVRCRMAHGADFAAVVQASFEKLVDHYARKWLVQNRVCVVEDYGSVSWNQSITSLFDTVDDVEAWLRSLGKEDWWVRENADPGGSGRAIAKADDDFVAGFNLLSVVRNEAHAQPESAAKSRLNLQSQIPPVPSPDRSQRRRRPQLQPLGQQRRQRHGRPSQTRSVQAGSPQRQQVRHSRFAPPQNLGPGRRVSPTAGAGLSTLPGAGRVETP
ncbi:hypothetical protein QBC47DRAFT_151783 [Echria macrotheca]|uniref:Uncharacterized protein n=1 Tax=Echria macrotheca TaxID=438768 RepID=A0AAJ0B306_9PEZI|nr:hypothetical protein QBC47DRAFT_151783 [Echria macrotheca]